MQQDWNVLSLRVKQQHINMVSNVTRKCLHTTLYSMEAVYTIYYGGMHLLGAYSDSTYIQVKKKVKVKHNILKNYFDESERQL